MEIISPITDLVKPKEFVEKADISKLSFEELSKYQTIVSKNILYLINKNIENADLEYGARLDNACCLSNVVDELEDLPFYFTYFMDLDKSR